jgi:DNA-binding transcriptional regulator YdaS (Cro superfamily)
MAGRHNGKKRRPAARRRRRSLRRTPFRDAIGRAIELHGSQGALAAACKVSQAAISKVRRTQQISPVLAKAIENATKGKVLAKTFRPDLWG